MNGWDLDLIKRDQEIEWLKTGPERVFLYVQFPNPAKPFAHYEQSLGQCAIRTWLGTIVSTLCYIGPRRYVGFGPCPGVHSYRRAVTARIFGTLYYGWYFESTGDYCRLKRAKRQ